MTKKEKEFKDNFYIDNGILDSTMNHIQGKMQAEASIEDSKELDESFFQNAMVNILRRKVHNISKSYTVTSNKTYPQFSSELKLLSDSSLRIQPDFIIKNKIGLPLAVFELKSIFGSGTTKTLLLKDIARLVLYKKLFPSCQCILIIAGKKDELKDFFEKSNFGFDNNVQSKISIPYSWKTISTKDLGITEQNYIKAINDLGIQGVQIKLSRTQYGQKYHSMSYIVREETLGYINASDFIETTWGCIISGDFVCIGSKPVNNIGQCTIVDNIDLSLMQVMYQTNDVDNQEWSEIDEQDIVWKYTPQGNRY